MGKLTATKKAISEAVDKALDMSREARMARAREMGFDTDTVLYHGTGADVDSLQPGQAPGWGEGVYLTDNPRATEEFAMRPSGNVIPAHAAIRNPFLGDIAKHPDVFTDANVMSAPSYKRKVRELGLDDDELFDWIDEWGEDGQFANELIRDLGFDGIMAPGSNNIDGLEVVAFDPSQVRSVNAAFDPAKSDSPNLLAGGAAAAVGLGAATQGEDASAMELAGQDFLQRRQEKRSQWDALRQDLIGAMDQAIQAIEMPWRGYLGLTRTAGGLVAGEGLDQALQAGAMQARQPVEQTAYDLGGQVTDATGSPAFGAAVNLGVNLGGPI